MVLLLLLLTGLVPPTKQRRMEVPTQAARETKIIVLCVFEEKKTGEGKREGEKEGEPGLKKGCYKCRHDPSTHEATVIAGVNSDGIPAEGEEDDNLEKEKDINQAEGQESATTIL